MANKNYSPPSFIEFVNAWSKYRERELRKCLKRNQVMDFLTFREAVNQILCKAEPSPARFKGRVSFKRPLNYCTVSEKKVLPISEARYGGFDHWPELMQIKPAQRCKLECCNENG